MKTWRWYLLNTTMTLSLAAGASSTANFKSYLIKDQKGLNALVAQMNRAQGAQKTWLRWQVALNAPQIGQTDLALQTLKSLQKSGQKIIGPDHLALTEGRLLFQKGQFEAALAAYEQVPKTSEYYFESLEEQAWSYIRMSQSDKALSKLTTLFSPVFATWVGPEAFYASSYNALRICDYTQVFKTSELFKSRHAARIGELEKLANTGANSQSLKVLPRLESGELNYLAYAEEAQALPRFFWRDEFLRQYAQQARSRAGNGADLKSLRGQMATRLQTLAKSELSEYKVVLNKLQLIEAEVIQRLYLDSSLKGQRPEVIQTKKSDDQITFPYQDELWLDEVDSYQAKVKSCPQLKEAKL